MERGTDFVSPGMAIRDPDRAHIWLTYPLPVQDNVRVPDRRMAHACNSGVI